MSRTEQELERLLDGVDRIHPLVDTAAVEAAFRRHFGLIGLVDIPELRWMDDGLHAMAVLSENVHSGMGLKVDPHYENRMNALQGSSRGAAYDPTWKLEEENTTTRLWTNDDHIAWNLVYDRWTIQNDDHPGTSVPRFGVMNGPGGPNRNFWASGWSGVGAGPSWIRRGEPATVRFGRSYSCATQCGKAFAWARLAAEDYSSRWTKRADPADLRKIAYSYAPFVDAYAAGLWMFFVLPDQVLLVPRPEMRFDDRHRLHNPAGPAVFWEAGEGFYFWHGVAVEEGLVMEPEKYITVARIGAANNAEIRRVMIERFGTDRYLIEGGAQIVSRDHRGTLYRKELFGDEPIVMVKVRNSSPEPDGSYKDYFIRVPPETRTASEAVAWTFGFDVHQYDPIKET